ncbi:MAG: hypothetical protein LQ342_006967 [Letrouitia transgressa]|nr:MAG: hypothetical protein LQ342_006967 [Letrouitia transgressa]
MDESAASTTAGNRPQKLTHTLQTWLGMVEDNGAARERILPSTPASLCHKVNLSTQGFPITFTKDLTAAFADCVVEKRLASFNRRANDFDLRFDANVFACCNKDIDIRFMKRNITALKRLDLEQAAAVIVSSINNDANIPNRASIIQALVLELDQILMSCMWLEAEDQGNEDEAREDKFSRLTRFMRWMLQTKHEVTVEALNDWGAFVRLLLRIRRCRPDSRNRCLFIPQWMFKAAEIDPPPEYRVWSSQGTAAPGHEPNCAPGDGAIVISRKNFKRTQRRLFNCNRYWYPEVQLRQNIKRLESDVLYNAKSIKSNVMTSTDSLVVAYHFFRLQRRLQRKVVSDMDWTSFLQKGESGKLLQNNPSIMTTFEEKLGEFGGQKGDPVQGDIVRQLDECCLVMESYVNVYGNGDPKNLQFHRGQRGGSGRGPVDEYNELCDIYGELCKAGREQGLSVPGPVHKFLAKDIMAWNKSFGDDAFADGKVPGWKPWLAERRASEFESQCVIARMEV